MVDAGRPRRRQVDTLGSLDTLYNSGIPGYTGGIPVRPVCTKLPPEAVERLDELAKTRGLSRSRLLREIILEALGVSGIPRYTSGIPEIEERIRKLEAKIEELEKKINKIAGLERYMWGGRSGRRVQR